MKPTLNYIVATAGHVDHGKTSLVKALTGTDPDRLPEEKARGITIDLGFAHFAVEGVRDGQPVTFNLGVVDVPGHEDFVKNMVAGVSSVNLALLVVAADDGWMPQTEEHFQILTYLGVTKGVVALTKIDLAQDEAAAIAAVRARLVDSPLADAPIVPTSIIAGRGLDYLRAALAKVLSLSFPPADISKPRLPVDRVFTLQGVGVIVTGTLTGAKMQKGDAVLIQPSGKRARIRTIHTYNHNVDESQPGTRTALNLSDVRVEELHRGDVITAEKFVSTSATWEVVVERSSHATGHPIKDGAQVRIHFGSGNAPARIVFLDVKNLAPGQRQLAQIRFDEPVFALVGDRFIVRDSAEQQTLAGGTILFVDAERRHFHTDQKRALLSARAESPHDPAAYIATELFRHGFARQGSLLWYSQFSADQIAKSTVQLQKENRVANAGELLVEGSLWKNLRARAAEFVDRAHRERPNERGAALNDLRAACDCAPELFDALLEDLCGNDFIQTGALISRKSHRLELPPELRSAAAKLQSALQAKPLDPPSVKDLTPDAASLKALRFLIQTGEVIEVSKEIVIAKGSFARAVDEVRAFLAQHASGTTSELRQKLGATRRVVIPLLEHLDKQGVTRRVGDARVLNRPND